MESWRLVWRDGFVPILTHDNLEVLRDALRADDPRLTQGSTITPPPLMCVQDWPAEQFEEHAVGFGLVIEWIARGIAESINLPDKRAGGSS